MTALEREFRALLHGKREGSLYIANEGDKTAKGKRTVVDKTRKKSKGGVKVMEKEEVEE